METIIERYSNKISGVLTCHDRVVITGTLPVLSNNKSMTSYLYSKGVRIFDYAKFAEPFRNQIRENAERLAKENQVVIVFVRKSETRKETIISELLAKRGLQPGLVHILSAMENCLINVVLPTWRAPRMINGFRVCFCFQVNKLLYKFLSKKIGCRLNHIP